MEVSICRFFNQPLEEIYNAYIRSIHTQFCENCIQTPYQRIEFKLKFSFRYNMNGGNCTLLFMSHKNGTAVYIQYNILQLVGARYKAHEIRMTSFVENQLHLISQQIFLNIDDFSYRPESTSYASPSTPATPFADTTVPSVNETEEIEKPINTNINTQEDSYKQRLQQIGFEVTPKL